MADSWKDMTAADVHARNAKIGGKASGVIISAPPTESPKKSRHKYRAIPCIVTDDLTLFTPEDLRQMDLANGRQDRGFSHMPMKRHAELLGIVGIWFASTKEGKRWIELVRLQAAGKIARLRRQTRWSLVTVRTNLRTDIVETFTREIAAYISDFDYDELSMESTHAVVEDCKGLRTPVYLRSKKHFEAQYGITIRET